MKKIFFALFIVSGLASCTLAKDLQSHCKFSNPEPVTLNGPNEICLTCDSLATIVVTDLTKINLKKK